LDGIGGGVFIGRKSSRESSVEAGGSGNAGDITPHHEEYIFAGTTKDKSNKLFNLN
jgi:hypothetical protein